MNESNQKLDTNLVKPNASQAANCVPSTSNNNNNTAVTDLDICLAKLTNPLIGTPTDEQIDQLCALCALERDGAQRVLGCLAYKAQSPQEYEALHALNVLAKVVKRGGFRIADEIGKFRFLNEIIKIVSPKYLAHRTSEAVRLRIVELVFSWAMEFKELPKIFEAYQMLKVQKIVEHDPVYVLENFRPPTPPQPRPRDEIFDDEKTVKTLKTLIDSGSRSHLEIANRLIKNLAMKAETRTRFKAQFSSEIEQIHNCAQLLTDMVTQCNSTLKIDPETQKVIYNGSTEEDLQLIRELLDSCEKSRVRLFKFANQIEEVEKELTGGSEPDPEESHFGRLIQTADMLTATINNAKAYLDLIEGKKKTQSGPELNGNPSYQNEERLLDLNSSPIRQQQNSLAQLFESSPANSTSGLSEMSISPAPPGSTHLLDHHSPRPHTSPRMAWEQVNQTTPTPPSSLCSSSLSMRSVKGQSESKRKFGKSKNSGYQRFRDPLDDLEDINERLKQQHLDKSPDSQQIKSPDGSVISFASSSGRSSSIRSEKEFSSLESLSRLLSVHSYISPNTIIPSKLNQKPMKILDQNEVQITMHYTGNRPHSQILVFLLTVSNYNLVPISGVQFVAAVSKDIKAKLLCQSGTWLPPFQVRKQSLESQRLISPDSDKSLVVPQNFISQVLLIAFNQKYLDRNKVEAGGSGETKSIMSDQKESLNSDSEYLFRLKFKLTYLLDEKSKCEHTGYYNWLVSKQFIDEAV